jgi:hypothetical protein
MSGGRTVEVVVPAGAAAAPTKAERRAEATAKGYGLRQTERVLHPEYRIRYLPGMRGRRMSALSA